MKETQSRKKATSFVQKSGFFLTLRFISLANRTAPLDPFRSTVPFSRLQVGIALLDEITRECPSTCHFQRQSTLFYYVFHDDTKLSDLYVSQFAQ